MRRGSRRSRRGIPGGGAIWPVGGDAGDPERPPDQHDHQQTRGAACRRQQRDAEDERCRPQGEQLGEEFERLSAGTLYVPGTMDESESDLDPAAAVWAMSILVDHLADMAVSTVELNVTGSQWAPLAARVQSAAQCAATAPPLLSGRTCSS